MYQQFTEIVSNRYQYHYQLHIKSNNMIKKRHKYRHHDDNASDTDSLPETPKWKSRTKHIKKDIQVCCNCNHVFFF